MSPVEQLQHDWQAQGREVQVHRMPPDPLPLPDDTLVVDVTDPGDVVLCVWERGLFRPIDHYPDEQTAADALRARLARPRVLAASPTPEEEAELRAAAEELTASVRRRVAEAARHQDLTEDRGSPTTS